jgi:TPR repeat protein
VAEAQHALGKAYLNGLFGEKSLEKGLALIRHAADADYPMALNTLGALYHNRGHGEAKNEKQVHEYYLAAAAGGDMVAMLNLANLYTRGAPGVPQDLPKAKTWASQSVENGNWGAQSMLEALQRAEQNCKEHGRQSQELLDTITDPHKRQCTVLPPHTHKRAHTPPHTRACTSLFSY